MATLHALQPPLRPPVRTSADRPPPPAARRGHTPLSAASAGASAPTASIVVPSHHRPEYLEVTLGSIVPQARALGAEVVVVNDGGDPATTAVAERAGVVLVTLTEHGGPNAARNAGIAAARGELLILIDDDVQAPAGWLEAYLAGAAAHPDYDVLGGPIAARLERARRGCGHDRSPITTLDAGAADADVARVWGANMAVRRRAIEAVGPFDAGFVGHGDEEDWELRYLKAGGRIRYLAAAGLDHRRNAADARITALARAEFRHGRETRRLDIRFGQARTLRAELRVLAGCAWHVLRRRCPYGAVTGARALGGAVEALWPVRPAPAADFLSGDNGLVIGIRLTARAIVSDALSDARRLLEAEGWRLRRAARRGPRRRILVLSVERPDVPNLLAETRAELARSRHEVELATISVGGRGKFENLNALLKDRPLDGVDWLLIVDDDVVLPAGFLDRFLFLVERFGLRVAQPAHRARSHAAWVITRRRAGAVARETAFVEIGPVTAFHADTFATLLPFPPLRAGWGLDAHWAAVAAARGWPIGVVDATAIRHGLRPIASAYTHETAIAEGREFLASRPYLPAAQAQRTLRLHRRW